MNEDSLDSIKAHHAEILKDLEELKTADRLHAEFYEDLKARQADIIRDLEAMTADE